MLRAFLVILAVLIAVLGFVLHRPWLYVGAIVPLIGVLGLLGWQLWETYRSQSRRDNVPSGLSAQNDSLEDFGIVDVRPHGATDSQVAEGDERDGQKETQPGAAETFSENDSPATGSPAMEGGAAPTSPNGERGKGHAAAGSSEGPVVSEDAPVLGPLMHSLRSALEAKTVCLLVQEEVLLTYRIQALASVHSSVKESGTFDAQVPLLTAGMSHQSVTIRALSASEVSTDDLNYYEAPPDIDHIAVAPIPRSDEPASYFLLADASAEADLGSSRSRTLLEHFAETAALLLDSRDLGQEDGKKIEREGSSNGQATPPSTEEDNEPKEEDQPRPRREIIAEEMEAAYEADEELALILVHLNRAESIARRGEDAVASAERLLRARLEQLAPNERVERFGELTYGIFFRGGVEAVEPWAADLQEAMDGESGELEGGVSVGVAVWGSRHDGPEALRTDATEALWEAYETGTCTIVA